MTADELVNVRPIAAAILHIRGHRVIFVEVANCDLKTKDGARWPPLCALRVHGAWRDTSRERPKQRPRHPNERLCRSGVRAGARVAHVESRARQAPRRAGSKDRRQARQTRREYSRDDRGYSTTDATTHDTTPCHRFHCADGLNKDLARTCRRIRRGSPYSALSVSMGSIFAARRAGT